MPVLAARELLPRRARSAAKRTRGTNEDREREPKTSGQKSDFPRCWWCVAVTPMIYAFGEYRERARAYSGAEYATGYVNVRRIVG